MITLLNGCFKGGNSKTTQSVILTHQLAQRGYRILFIDFDPQMSGTRFLSSKPIHDTLFQEKNIFKAVQADDLQANIIKLKPNIDYVPGNEYINLFETMMEYKQISADKRHLYFKVLLSAIYEKELYDFVIMDMSPSKSVLNTAVMATASHHVVVSQCEVLSIEMIQKYKADIEDLQMSHQIESEILAISLTMGDRTRLGKQAIEVVKSNYGELVFKTITKRKSRIAEYSSDGYPEKNIRGLYYVKDSEALSLHQFLTNELLTRLGLPIKKGEILNEWI